MLNDITNIPAPRVEFIDPRTGLMAREWYRFFLNLFQLTGNGQNSISLEDLQLSPAAQDTLGELGIVYDQAQLASMMAQYEQATVNLQNQIDTAPSAPQLGTLASQNADNVRLIGFSTNPSPAVPNPAPTGTLYWDGNSTLGLQMDQGVLAKLGQSQFTYVKASATITKGQLCKHTGAVGGSGVITAAPTSIGMTDSNQIVGVAAENIALNGFGFIQDSGDLRGFDTTGSSVGEVWADGDPLYYNPAYVGGLTKNKPSAPNLKSYIGEVINASSGGSGSIQIRMSPGSILGGTDANVQFGTLADKDLIQYDSALQYWKNVPISSISVTTATNLAGGTAGSVPYQSGANTTTFLSLGTAAQVLQVNAGATAPEWVSSTGTGNVVRATSPTLASPLISNLTSGRVTYATTSGQLTDSANLLYSGTDLTVYGVRVGRGAGAVSTTTAVGRSAANANTTGGFSTYVGYQSGLVNTTGYFNTAVGARSLEKNDAGISNSTFGVLSLFNVVSGNYNSAFGDSSLLNATGSNNTAFGYNSGSAITSGAKNTILGCYTGNAGGLDIRTSSNYIVLSDGDGNPRWLTDNNGATGYSPGTGGAITQATSRTTGVTLNKSNGAITLVSAAGSSTYQTFTVTNSTVAATDTIIVNQKSGTDKYIILVTAVAAGSFNITFATTGGTTTEQPVFNFAVIKATTA